MWSGYICSSSPQTAVECFLAFSEAWFTGDTDLVCTHGQPQEVLSLTYDTPMTPKVKTIESA